MPSWNKGDRVVQATYGSGTVLDVDDQHIVIHFDRGGRRTFATQVVVLKSTGESPASAVTATLPPMPGGSGRILQGSTTTVGFRNANGQAVLRETNVPGTLAGEKVYVLACGHCGVEYGANGCDIGLRKCPSCMGGEPGLAY
jgi:hypothetical protein